MKQYTILALFAFFISYFSYSQGGIVRGTITDADFQDPVPFANILVKETGTGTTSDFDGNFEIFLDEGIYTLQFSYLGYKTIEISEVEINSLNPKEVNVIMEVLVADWMKLLLLSVLENTESAVLSFQKKSASLVDGLFLRE